MTALDTSRKKITLVGVLIIVLGLCATIGLGQWGVRSLVSSSAGQAAEVDAEVYARRFPYTATALLGVVDADGWLTSVTIMVIEPDGTGGYLFSLSPSANTATGDAEPARPLAAVLAVEGAEAFRSSVESLTNLSIDLAEIVDRTRLTQLLTPLGDVPVELPIPVEAHEDGVSLSQGTHELGTTEIASLLSTRASSFVDWYLDPARAAAWAGIATRVGAGIGAIPDVDSDLAMTTPGSIDAFLERLFGGAVSSAPIPATGVAPGDAVQRLAPALAQVAALGRPAAMVDVHTPPLRMLLGAAAPGRLGAPHDAPTFRLVNALGPDDMPTGGLNRGTVSAHAIAALDDAAANIVSFADAPGTAPDVTSIEVANGEQVVHITQTYGPLFGEVEVSVSRSPIRGVAVEVILGRSYLDKVLGRSAPTATVAGEQPRATTSSESND